MQPLLCYGAFGQARANPRQLIGRMLFTKFTKFSLYSGHTLHVPCSRVACGELLVASRLVVSRWVSGWLHRAGKLGAGRHGVTRAIKRKGTKLKVDEWLASALPAIPMFPLPDPAK
jgi:hypothetical protein